VHDNQQRQMVPYYQWIPFILLAQVRNGVNTYYAPTLGGHFGITRSVRLSVPRRSSLGYRHAGCLQLSHRRPSEMCGQRTRPRTDVDPSRFLSPSIALFLIDYSVPSRVAEYCNECVCLPVRLSACISQESHAQTPSDFLQILGQGRECQLCRVASNTV